VLPATRQRWFSRLYPGMLSVLIYRPRKDERLSSPRCGAGYTKTVYPETVTHPSTNPAWRRVTTFIETNVLPLSQATTCNSVIQQPATLAGKYLFTCYDLYHQSTCLSGQIFFQNASSPTAVLVAIRWYFNTIFSHIVCPSGRVVVSVSTGCLQI